MVIAGTIRQFVTATHSKNLRMETWFTTQRSSTYRPELRSMKAIATTQAIGVLK
jgi:hypothetical protein